jgi:hypothetical protein
LVPLRSSHEAYDEDVDEVAVGRRPPPAVPRRDAPRCCSMIISRKAPSSLNTYFLAVGDDAGEAAVRGP